MLLRDGDPVLQPRGGKFDRAHAARASSAYGTGLAKVVLSIERTAIERILITDDSKGVTHPCQNNHRYSPAIRELENIPAGMRPILLTGIDLSIR